MSRTPPNRAVRVGVLAYPGCFGAEIFGLTDLLLIANRVAEAAGRRAVFEVSVIATTAGSVRTAGGFPVGAGPATIDLDALVVPGFEFVPAGDLDPLLDGWRDEAAFVGEAAAQGVPVSSVCIGALLLGAAGLLDGRSATTSWLFARHLAERHPQCDLTPESIVVTDRDVTTTGGFSAVHDLAMLLIRRHAGDTVARRTARVTLIADNRTSQAPYVDPTMLTGAPPRFARDVQRWLVERLDEPYELAALAAAFNVSTRTMLRRFAAECGCTPLDHLQQVRVDRAKYLLERPGSTVASAMEAVGYHDAGSFRRLFSDRVGMTPAAYRRQFRATPTAVAAPS